MLDVLVTISDGAEILLVKVAALGVVSIPKVLPGLMNMLVVGVGLTSGAETTTTTSVAAAVG